MKIEKGIISSSQLTVLVFGLLEASTLTTAFVSSITKQNTWAVFLAGFIIMLIMLLVYTELNIKFPCKNLIEINDEIYGKYLGKIFSILYIYYFWFIIPENLRFIADFFSTYLFPDTDINVFIIVVTTVGIYTIKNGLEVIARLSIILMSFILISSIFLTILVTPYIKLSNFLPVFEIGLKQFIQGTNLVVSIPLGEIIAFTMIFPYVNKQMQVRKAAFIGYFIGGISFFIFIFRNTAVLGNLRSIHILPSYQVAKLVNIGEIITRTEILVAITLLFIVFLKISIFYYATVLSMAQFFKLHSYKPLVIPIGIISGIFAVTMYNSSMEEGYNASIYAVFVIPFIILFPLISLIVVWVKKLINK